MNVNTFVALVLAQTTDSPISAVSDASVDEAQVVQTFGFDQQGMEVLKVVFKDNDTRDDMAIVAKNLPAAAVWILEAGEWFRAQGMLSDERLRGGEGGWMVMLGRIWAMMPVVGRVERLSMLTRCC